MARLFTTSNVGTNKIKYIGTTQTITDTKCLTDDLFQFGNEESYKWYVDFNFNSIRFGLPVSFLSQDLDDAILAYDKGSYGSSGAELISLLNSNALNFRYYVYGDQSQQYGNCKLDPPNQNAEVRFDSGDTVTSTTWNSSITYYLTNVFTLDTPVTFNALITSDSPYHLGFMINDCKFLGTNGTEYAININNNNDQVVYEDAQSIYEFYCYDIRSSGLGTGIGEEFTSGTGHLSDPGISSDEYEIENNIGIRRTTITGDILTIQVSPS